MVRCFSVEAFLKFFSLLITLYVLTIVIEFYNKSREFQHLETSSNFETTKSTFSSPKVRNGAWNKLSCEGPNHKLCQRVMKFFNKDPPYLKRKSRLCDIMTKYNSDKCFKHRYTTLYEFLMAPYRDKEINILEVGLGNNITSAITPGASLRGWREYFPKANIFGGDIDRHILFNDTRIRTSYVDQLDSASIDKMVESFGGLRFDIIIEDGLHRYDANINCLDTAFKYLKPGGLYIMEDIFKDKRELLAKYIRYFTENGYQAALIGIETPESWRSSMFALIENH